MMKCAFATLLLCAVSAQASAGGRIQDLSMSPNEMIQQNMNVNRAGTPLPGPNLSPTIPAVNSNGQGGRAPITGVPSSVPSNNYMEGYCDPNFKPLIARNAQYASMAACLEKQKNDACRLYNAVPNDVRVILDESINCMAQASNAAGENGGWSDDEDNVGATGGGAMIAHCGVADTRRLALLKNYWNDTNTAYAIVYVPDLVMDNSGSCLNRR